MEKLVQKAISTTEELRHAYAVAAQEKKKRSSRPKLAWEVVAEHILFALDVLEEVEKEYNLYLYHKKGGVR